MSPAYGGSSAKVMELPLGRQNPPISDVRSETRGAVVLTFRGYRVYPTARRIVMNDREICLGARAFDLLVALLRARGRIVSQFEIVRQVWPSTTVESCNLRFQMGVLRKALGEDRDAIKTIRGRGYLIVEDCDRTETQPIEGSRSPVRLRDDAVPPASVFVTCAGIADQFEPDPIEAGEFNRRLAELEQENVRLKLAIASLTLGRLAQILPQDR